MDWPGADEGLLEFTRRVSALRKGHPVFRRRQWFQGRPIHGSEVKDLTWFDPSGAEMTEQQWNEGFAKALGVLLSGKSLQRLGPDGRHLVDDDFLVLFNAHHEPIDFTLPAEQVASRWESVLETDGGDAGD